MAPVKVEDESQTSGSGPMMSSSYAASSSSGQGPEAKSGKRKKNGVERKYVSIQCTGYLKSWPCTKVGLGTDFPDQEGGDESSLSCLVAVARLQPSFSASIDDSVERGIFINNREKTSFASHDCNLYEYPCVIHLL